MFARAGVGGSIVTLLLASAYFVLGGQDTQKKETPPDEIKPPAADVANELTQLELKMQKLMEKIIPDDNTITMTFPVGDEEWKTAWKVTWDIQTVKNERNRTNHFFRIDKAFFKTGPKEPWLQVLGDTRVSELFAAYSDGKTRFNDMRDFSFPLLKLSSHDVGIRGRVIGKEGKVAAEIRDRGVLWGKTSKASKGQLQSRRGQDLTLWAILHASNYFYLIQYSFQDDGTVALRCGATGHNLPFRTDVAHIHNSCWRVNVNLGGTGKNTVYLVSHKEEAAGAGKAEQKETPFTVEGSGEWHPKEFNMLRVKTALSVGEDKSKQIAYDLIPIRQGSARHYGKGEDFTHHDFWVTPNTEGEIYYYNLPKYLKKPDPRPTKDADVVLWYMSSAIHVPRSEDGHLTAEGQVMKNAAGVALTSWTGFDLRPRNVFVRTPIYP
jgi:hypothetical protein